MRVHPLVHAFVRDPRSAFLTARSLPSFVRVVSRHYGVGSRWVVQRGRTLLAARFTPDEAFALGLFDPALPAAAIRKYVSKSELTRIQILLNPAPWVPLVEDKGLFYRYCEAHRLATPRLLAILYRTGPGWTPAGPVPPSTKAWTEVLLHQLPDRFLLKPTWSVYGRGIMVLQRSGETLTDHTGRAWNVLELLRTVSADPADRGVLLQEVAQNHEALQRLSGTQALQTIRVVTFAHGSEVDVCLPNIKLIVGKNIIDNIDGGRTGNIAAMVDLATGTLEAAITEGPQGIGATSVERHPVTGEQIAGFVLPHWSEVLSLSRRAAKAFLPLRTVGWDVAVTPEGACLIEGNAWSDPPTMFQGNGLREVAEAWRRDAR